jgi:hypothetical protein
VSGKRDLKPIEAIENLLQDVLLPSIALIQLDSVSRLVPSDTSQSTRWNMRPAR